MCIRDRCLYTDRPHAWDAWDIDPGYEASARPIDGDCETWELVEAGPLRARLRTERELGVSSRMIQEFVLDAGSPRLDIRTRVDWRESHMMLRALCPVDVRATEATYGIQFGHVTRPTHRNTHADAAMFEVCAHGWADLSQPGLGFALLDDGKYGRSCHDNVMGMTLLRSSTHPDPEADRGEHAFTYSLMPHEGDWRAAGVDVEAALLNNPMRARTLPIDQSGPAGESWSPAELIYAEDTTARLEIAALKRAEDSDALIVRLVEVRGGRGEVAVRWGLDVARVRVVDGLERPLGDAGDQSWLDDGCTLLDVSSFEIVTLEATLA